MSTRLRLTATSPGRWSLLAVGYALVLWFGRYTLLGVVEPARPGGERALAVVFTLVLVAALLALPLTAPRRLRWLEVDGHGLRLVRGSGAVAAEVPWADLAGVGLLVDPTAARHQVRGGSPVFRMIMYRVPPWLELVPASGRPVPPGLGPVVPAADDRPARWMVRLNEGWARRPDVAGAVRRRRPDLWLGERDGSVPTSVASRASAGVGGPTRRGWSPAPVSPAPVSAEPVSAEPADEEPLPLGPARRHPSRPPEVLDLPRAPRVRAALLRAVPAALVAAAAVIRPDAVTGPARIVLLVAGPLAAAFLLLALFELAALRSPVRLVADDRRLALEQGGRTLWRVPWSDVAGIREERRRGRSVLVVRPTGPAAVDAHPELARRMRSGAEGWRLPLGPGVTGVRELVVARRPDLWS